MTPSAHLDTFARDRLPPREEWPELIFDQPELQYPARLNCAGEILDRAVDQRGWGERIALHGPLGRVSYAELRAQANRIARVLTEDMGLIPGNRVLLHSPNSPLMAACWFAIQKAGGIAVSSMPLLRAKELTDIVGKAKISHALCDLALRDELVKAQGECPSLKQVVYFSNPAGDGPLEQAMAGKADTFANVDTAADDVAMIAFTSGTTGRPKGTMHFHRDVLAICDCFPRSILKIQPDDVVCGTAPMAFTFGLGTLLLFPLRYGASAVLGIKPGPEELLNATTTYRATILAAVPSSYRMMLPLLRRYDLGSLRKCISAGEALTQATREAWELATGIRMIDGIGATEMLHIFISATEDQIRPGAVGRPIPGYQAAVLDGDFNPLPPGQVGKLGVKGPTGCRYLDDPRQADYVKKGWNLTGDAFLMDADGYFIYQARTDDMIISAGNNIAGLEVEDALAKHPAVAECAVIGVPDDARGQAVKAFVVLKPEYEESEEMKAELQAHAKDLIAPFKHPRLIEFRRTLPRTETGKLQRFRLREENLILRPTPATPLPAGSMPASTQTPLHAVGRQDVTPEPELPLHMQIVEPAGWDRPRGFSNGILARGAHLSVAGQIGWDAQLRFRSDNFTEQARQALQNVVDVVRAAGGKPEHIVRLTWFITNKREYIAQSRELGRAYRSIMGRFYPPMSVVQVASLLEDRAKVEIEATAILPDDPSH